MNRSKSQQTSFRRRTSPQNAVGKIKKLVKFKEVFKENKHYLRQTNIDNTIMDQDAELVPKGVLIYILIFSIFRNDCINFLYKRL